MDVFDKIGVGDKNEIVIRGFHVDPKEDRGVFWICCDGEKLAEFTSCREVEQVLKSFMDFLINKHGKKIALNVTWDLDYSNSAKGAEKSLEQCSPSYREKKIAMLEARKKKKAQRSGKRVM